MKKLFVVLDFIAKLIFIAGFIAITVFFGWRILHKREYSEQQAAQCRAYAVSSLMTTANILRNTDSPTTQMIIDSGKLELVADYRNVPGDNTVNLMFNITDNGFDIKCTVRTGWNTRSPHEYIIDAKITHDGTLICNKSEDNEYAKSLSSLKQEIQHDIKEQVFTFPYDKPCHAPFKTQIAKVVESSGKELFIFIPEKE